MNSLLVISDGHTNSTVGLSKPKIDLDEGESHLANQARTWLWRRYNEILEWAAKEARGDLYGVINGDAVEMDDKRRSIQLISRNRAEVLEMGCDVYDPFFDLCRGVYVMRGTEAHTGKNGEMEEMLAMNFDNTIRNPETGRASWWWLPLELDGVRMDIMHHPKGAGGGRPMNSQGSVDRLASDTLFNYANEGEAPPHLVIRSHLHGYRDSKDAFRTRAIITPALSFLTAYTYRIGINMTNPVGGMMVFCHNGEFAVKTRMFNVRKTEWQIL